MTGRTQFRRNRTTNPGANTDTHLSDADTIVDVLLSAVDHAYETSFKGDYSIVQHVPGMGAYARTAVGKGQHVR